MSNTETSVHARQLIDKYSNVFEMWERGHDPLKKAMVAVVKEAAGVEKI